MRKKIKERVRIFRYDYGETKIGSMMIAMMVWLMSELYIGVRKC